MRHLAARTNWSLLTFAAAVILQGCTGPAPPAQVPVSGDSASRGGATREIYYDQQGHAHFRN